jgi:hypothetical protein
MWLCSKSCVSVWRRGAKQERCARAPCTAAAPPPPHSAAATLFINGRAPLQTANIPPPNSILRAVPPIRIRPIHSAPSRPEAPPSPNSCNRDKKTRTRPLPPHHRTQNPIPSARSTHLGGMKLTASPAAPASCRAGGRAAAAPGAARANCLSTTSGSSSSARLQHQQQQQLQRPAQAASAAAPAASAAAPAPSPRPRRVACAAASPEAAAAAAAGAAADNAAEAAPASTVWELDFCSRPLLDERGKKVWELLITDPERSFEHSQYFPNSRINSAELRRAVDALLARPGAVKPDRVRFFRGQMSTIITKALTDAGIKAVPSRRCFGVMCEWRGVGFVAPFCAVALPPPPPPPPSPPSSAHPRPPSSPLLSCPVHTPPPIKNNHNSPARGARGQRLPAGLAVQQRRGRRAVHLCARPGRARGTL